MQLLLSVYLCLNGKFLAIVYVQKKYEYKGENSFHIRRTCLLNCKERSSKDGSYTMCCTSNLCNGCSSSYVVKDHRWLLLTASFVSVLSAMLRI